MPRSSVAVLLLVTFALAQPVAAQTTPGDLCSGDPCRVAGVKAVDPGPAPSDLLLDFGDVALVLQPSARLSIGRTGARRVTFRARSVTLDPGAQISGGGDDATVVLQTTAGGIAVAAAGATKAKIAADGNSAGAIELRATGGDVAVDGLLSAQGSGEDSSGGSIVLAGGAITVTSDIDAHAGGFSDLNRAAGGSVTAIAQGELAVSGAVDASSADGGGGSIALVSIGGDVHVNGALRASGDGPEGEGGSIGILALSGAVSIGAPISATGSSGTDDGDPVCGDGGTLLVRSHGALTLAADVKLAAGSNCAAGEVLFDPGTGTPVLLTAAFVSDGDLTQLPGASIDAHGAGYDPDNLDCGSGGDVYLAARGSATLETVDASAACEAGTISVNAGAALTVAGHLDASTSGADTTGGHVSVRACTVDVPVGGRLDARGAVAGAAPDGRTLVQASGAMTIRGGVLAEAENRLEYKTVTPDTAGATIDPAPTTTANQSLPDCAAIPLCGNGTLDPGEACDDGNVVDCDGCRGDCSRADRVCGDGIAECGETCDDHNATGGDGCSATCAVEGPTVLEFEGSPTQPAGCLAEWEVRMANGVLDSTTGKPRRTQKCVDGDPACDRDLKNDLRCSFDVQVCLRRTDGLIPGCTPAAIASVKVSAPSPLTATGVNLTNAQTIAGALHALGVTVTSGTEVVFPGAPQSAQNDCTPRFTIVVPHTATRSNARDLRIVAKDVNGLSMDKNEISLGCYPNKAVCGNGILETYETCDDGNDVSCDGCSSSCHTEACGNGVVDCGEQCDDGVLNGTPGDRCSAECALLPPPLRIPGGGSQAVDCAYEWSAELNPGQLQTDTHALPRNRQVCTDGDPLCDHDPTPGLCRLRLWACLAGADARLGCPAAGVASVDIASPKASASGTQLQARLALFGALQALGLPVGPGEACTGPVDVDVPVGRKGKLKLKTKAARTAGHGDGDQLSLECLAP